MEIRSTAVGMTNLTLDVVRCLIPHLEEGGVLSL